MISTVIELSMLGWAVLCAGRAVMSREHKISVGTRVAMHVPVQFAYQSYLKVREYYLELSRAHRKYELADDDSKGIIHVWEKSGFQLVKHQYRITQVDQDACMKLVSENSEVTIFGVIKSHSRSEVAFTFEAASEKDSRVGLNINIVFPSVIRHFLALLVLTDVIWQVHANDEMQGLVRIIEGKYGKQGNMQLSAA